MPKVYREYANNEGTPYYENLETKTTTWNRPTNGFLEHETNNGETYYENIQTGQTRWNLNNNSASTVSNASSVTASSASNAEAARLREELASRNREVEELRKQLAALKASTTPAAPAAAGPSANDPVVGRFVKMLKMGVPRPGVEQKMRAEGLDPSLLNGKSSSGAAVASAPAARPAGPPAFLAGIGAAKLKKANVTNKKPLANAKPQKTGAQAAAASLAEEAQRKALARQQRATMSIEERLAAEKAAKEAAKAAGPKTGFAAFANELGRVAGRRRSGSGSESYNNNNNRWSTASTPRARRRKTQRRSRKH